MTSAEAVVRRRRPADLPALGTALLAQQSQTRYPFRDPLPVPVEEFLHAHDAVAAWVADLDDRPVGHVCVVGSARTVPAGHLVDEVCAAAHGCDPGDLAWIGSLFVAAEVRGRGLGRLLLHAAVDELRRQGARPCLEVLPAHPAAISLYEATGWRTVHRLRPDWLVAAAGDAGPDVHVMVLDVPAP